MEVPPELVTYVDKVARHAYWVIDSDIEEILGAGYSEDVVFEITLSAALGAGMGRLERGLSALKRKSQSSIAATELGEWREDLPQITSARSGALDYPDSKSVYSAKSAVEILQGKKIFKDCSKCG